MPETALGAGIQAASYLVHQEIKGPDNPTCQLLPISRNKMFKRDGEGKIDKGGGGGSIS